MTERPIAPSVGLTPIGFDGRTYPPKDLPAVYQHGPLTVYRASSFGSCIKELVATRCGFEPAPFPPNFTKIFADGHRGEDVIVDKLERDGWTITRRQETVELEVLPGVVIRGHIDGVCAHPELCPEPAVFDAKTTSAAGISAALMEKYRLQVSTYAHSLGLSSAWFGVGTKDRESGDVIATTIHQTDSLISLAEIRAKAAKVESMARHYLETGDLPTCDEKQYPCSQFKLHQGGGDLDDPYGGFFKTTAEDDSLDRYAAMYVEAAQREAAAKDEKANARKLIVAHVGGEENRTTGAHKIAFVGSGIGKELNKQRLERYLASLGPGAPKLDDFYDTKSRSKTINVSTIGDDA